MAARRSTTTEDMRRPGVCARAAAAAEDGLAAAGLRMPECEVLRLAAVQNNQHVLHVFRVRKYIFDPTFPHVFTTP